MRAVNPLAPDCLVCIVCVVFCVCALLQLHAFYARYVLATPHARKQHLQEQAARGKAAEVLNQERNDRLLNEINEAPRIIDRVPHARRKNFLMGLKEVQLIFASMASQEIVATATGPCLYRASSDAFCMGRAV